ncbi:hypothetical protein BMS3Abin04_01902 [bacterium BMS3Abin04]|nr:hypothetical protein BMS3Abin04_01902 [bacterium BMS3Abin04]
MKTFEVVLTKSYIIKIKAENENSAKEFSQFYTSDILDLSNEKDREKYKFSIEDIDCKINDIFEIRETNENN